MLLEAQIDEATEKYHHWQKMIEGMTLQTITFSEKNANKTESNEQLLEELNDLRKKILRVKNIQKLNLNK